MNLNSAGTTRSFAITLCHPASQKSKHQIGRIDDKHPIFSLPGPLQSKRSGLSSTTDLKHAKKEINVVTIVDIHDWPTWIGSRHRFETQTRVGHETRRLANRGAIPSYLSTAWYCAE